MNSTERLFSFKVSLIMGVRMLGLFMLFPVMSFYASTSKRGLAMGIFSTSQFLGTFFGGAIRGLIYNIYDLNSVFLLSIFVAIICWCFMITLPHKEETLQELIWQALIK